MSGAGMLSTIGPLARRSVARTLRQPAEYAPAIIFPLVLLAVLTGGLSPTAEIPGFPADAYLDFVFGGIFVLGAINNALNSGSAIALDIQSGFLRRMSLTRVRPTAILAAQISGALAVALIQAFVFLAVGFAFGVRIRTGLGGVLVIVAFTLLITIAFAAFAALLALRTGSAEVVQGLAPVFIFLTLLSSFLLPRALIASDWFRAVTAANPMSYLIEGFRSLVISSWNSDVILKFLGVAGGLVIVSVTASVGAFERRAAMR